MSQPLTFKSRIDTWVLVTILLVVSIAVLAVDALLSLEAGYGWVGVGIVGLAGILLPLWILTHTSYDLGDRYLTVHCGPFRREIPIAEITDVSATRSSARSPALSTDRLRIDYGEGHAIMISPDHRDMFMRSLEARRAELGAGSPAQP